MSSGEVEETCLARMFPDFDSLLDDGQFEVLAKSVYAPLRLWAMQKVSVSLHGDIDESTEVVA